MPKKLLFAFLSLSLFVTACQPKTQETSDEVSSVVDEDVSLASEDMAQSLDASFLSKHGSFSYRMTYDGALLTMMETEDASVPYFEVQGGSIIQIESDWVATVSEDAEKAGTPVRVGSYDVYQFMDAEGTCSLSVTLVPYSEEVLRLTLKTCEGADAELGREALDQILQGLVLEAK